MIDYNFSVNILVFIYSFNKKRGRKEKKLYCSNKFFYLKINLSILKKRDYFWVDGCQEEGFYFIEVEKKDDFLVIIYN